MENLVYDSLQFSSAEKEYRDKWLDLTVTDFNILKRHITQMCRGKMVVLLIDEGMYTPSATEGRIYNSPWNIEADFEVVLLTENNTLFDGRCF